MTLINHRARHGPTYRAIPLRDRLDIAWGVIRRAITFIWRPHPLLFAHHPPGRDTLSILAARSTDYGSLLEEIARHMSESKDWMEREQWQAYVKRVREKL